MKLLIANHHLVNRAGSELHTLDLCRGFRRAGHQVVVFTLKPGIVADVLKEEGFSVFSLPDLRSLSGETFDLIYLHHATCEVVLGSVFAGKIPIVRGYLGFIPPLEKPVNGNFLSGEVYVSELVEQTYADFHPGVPSMIARNVYDDWKINSGAAFGEPHPRNPNFAVVANHLNSALAGSLEAAASKGFCRFTHFGLPHNSVSVTAELLMPFDAVITIGRTVLVAVALGKPVYVCGVHGADGWLTQESFHGSQSRNFSGRMLAIEDWSLVRQQLLDTSWWPSLDDLAWLRERVGQDHALSRRVEQLEAFFAEVIEDARSHTPIPGGYKAITAFIEEKDKLIQGLRDERRKVMDAFEKAEAEAKAQTLRARRLDDRARELDQRIKQLEARSEHLTSRAQGLNRQLRDLQNSTTWKVLSKLGNLRSAFLGSQRRTN